MGAVLPPRPSCLLLRRCCSLAELRLLRTLLLLTAQVLLQPSRTEAAASIAASYCRSELRLHLVVQLAIAVFVELSNREQETHLFGTPARYDMPGSVGWGGVG